MARMNISIPDPLYARLDRLRDRVNASKVCAGALEKELDMIEARPPHGPGGRAARGAPPGAARALVRPRAPGRQALGGGQRDPRGAVPLRRRVGRRSGRGAGADPPPRRARAARPRPWAPAGVDFPASLQRWLETDTATRGPKPVTAPAPPSAPPWTKRATSRAGGTSSSSLEGRVAAPAVGGLGHCRGSGNSRRCPLLGSGAVSLRRITTGVPEHPRGGPRRTARRPRSPRAGVTGPG